MANDRNDDVFDIELRYSSTGDDEALKAADDIDEALNSIKENSLLDLELSLDGEQDLLDVADEVDRLNGETIDTTVNVDDSDLKTADTLRDNLNEDTDTTANVEDSQLKDANDKLDVIKNFEILNFVWNVAGTAVDFFKSTAEFTVGPILEYDTALSTIQARTGAMIPNAQELISDLYTDGWGESRQQIADVIVQADQLGISMGDLEEATRSAFEVSAVTGDDVQSSLRTINNLAKQMGISYSDAADLVVAGTQEGANAAGDLQEALIEFGPKLRDMGITGEGALSIIKSGLDAGAKSASDVLDGVKELSLNIGKIGKDQDVTNAFNTLDRLSTSVDLKKQLDLYRQGKLSGDEFLQGLSDAISEADTVDPTKTQAAVGTLYGSKGEDLGAGVFGGLKTNFDENATAIEGRAADAGTAIHDNITSKFEEVTRTIGDNIASYLEDNTGIDTFLNNFETGIQDTLDALKSGEDIGDAITIGLKPLGLDDEFQKLESIFGNLVISFLRLVADIQDTLDKDSSGTRAEVARLGANQLTFDLKVGNPDDVAAEIATAVDRGVTPDQIAKSASTAVTELVKNGATDQAQTLVDQLKGGQISASVIDPFRRRMLAGQNLPVDFKIPISPEMTPDELNKFIEDQKAAFHASGNDIEVTVLPRIDEAQINDLQKQIDDALVAAQPTVSLAAKDDTSQKTYGGGLAAQDDAAQVGALTAIKDAADQATVSVDALQHSQDQLNQAADIAPYANDPQFVDSFQQLLAQAQEADDGIKGNTDHIATSMQSMDAATVNAISGNTMITEFEALRTSADTELPGVVDQLNAINDVSFAGIEGEIDSLIAKLESLQTAATGVQIESIITGSSGGGTGGTNTTNVNQTNTYNVQSNAQAVAAGTVTLDGMRGFQ